MSSKKIKPLQTHYECARSVYAPCELHGNEMPLSIRGHFHSNSVGLDIKSKIVKERLEFRYPTEIWRQYPAENKQRLIDNISYLFTAHLPLLTGKPLRLEYHTRYPQIFSWVTEAFLRFVPSYPYLHEGQKGNNKMEGLRTMLDRRVYFAPSKPLQGKIRSTKEKNIVIPFTFGKDSFLTYHLAKDIGLSPTLVYFNEPTEEYTRQHKLNLIKDFSKESGEHVYFTDNSFGRLRAFGSGWFGWEMALSSWALFALPFAYAKAARYIVFANEASCNHAFYDQDGLKVMPQYEQSWQATEAMSAMTQTLSGGTVFTTSFLEGIYESGVIALLKARYHNSLKYLMSCWAETKAAKFKRWCGICAKCARIYLYLLANNVDPKFVGFKDNMLTADKADLFEIFHADDDMGGALATDKEEQLLAFYILCLQGRQDALVKRFKKSAHYNYVKKNFKGLVTRYYTLHNEIVTPTAWRKKLHAIINGVLTKRVNELYRLQKGNK
jgi:hypothetical protein